MKKNNDMLKKLIKNFGYIDLCKIILKLLK